MKERPLLVGGGVIAAHYRRAFSTSRRYELCALADIDEHCPARALYDVPFYTDARTAAGKSKAEVALLATPCATHYPLARELLELGVKVITEKPMCDTLDRVKELLSSKNAGCLFHWSHAEEVCFLREHLGEWGKIHRIRAHICDDYAAEGSVRADRRGLGGAWRDSGINVLSYFGELLDLGGAKLLSSEVVRDGGGQDVYAKKRFRFGETEGEILVDWRSADRRKVSTIECARGRIEIDHTAQTVRLNGETVFSSPAADRLSSHYERALDSFTFDERSRAHALLLHEILFTEENA